MKRYLFLLFLTLYSIHIFSQNLQNGLILSKDYKNGEQSFLIPSEGFTIYNFNFHSIGKLEKMRNTEEQLPIFKIGDTEYEISFENFEQIGYEIFCLRYFNRKNGFVEIDPVRNYWLKESEIVQKGYKITEWHTFFEDNNGELLGLYPNEPGLNLRKEPTVSSEKLMTLKGDIFEINLLGEKMGLWQKVEVKRYKEHICSSSLSEEENFIETLVGWVKLLDNSGLPNVYFYPKGC